jgi:signal transduction histidine kinase
VTLPAPIGPAHLVASTARRQLVLAAGFTLLLLMAGLAASSLMPRQGVAQVESILGHLQAAVLFGAASLGLLSGRWVARTSVGFACAAMLVLAFAGAVSGTVEGLAGPLPVLYTLGAALAVVLLLAAAAAPEVDDVASFRRLLSRESAPMALLALVALSPVVDAVLMASVTMPPAVRITFSAMVAFGCLIGAAQVLTLARPRLAWLPAVLVILAVEVLVRSYALQWSGAVLVALALKALAGAFALVGAAMAARAALVSTTDGMTSMLQDLSAMQVEDNQRRARDSERLHEVRSVLAGLHAATGSLRKYEDSLDPEVRRRIEDAVGAELNRLNYLIDPSLPEASSDLDLEAVVMSVVVAEREQGQVITTDLAEVSVNGSAAQIATLVSDLLVNARMHAPGSAVRLTARVEGNMVSLSVRDWGPGLSPDDAARVFERSYRGARSLAEGVPGSGLGLHTARRLARQMNGDLQVRAPSGGGCCFVATLPVAPGTDDQALETLETLEGPDADLSAGESKVIQLTPRPDTRTHHRPTGRDETFPYRVKKSG